MPSAHASWHTSFAIARRAPLRSLMSSVNEVAIQLRASDIHLGNTLGAELIGLIFSAILFGIINVQVHIYYQSTKDEPRFLKWMIAFVWLLNAFLFALTSYYDYLTFVTHFSDLTVIGQVPWCLSLFSAISEISLFIIRLFYTRRIWIMSDRNLILTVTAVRELVVLFCTIFMDLANEDDIKSDGIHFQYHFRFSTNVKRRECQLTIAKWLMLTGNAIAAVADLWNAIPLCYFLRRGKSGLHNRIKTVDMLLVYFNAMLASVNSRERLLNEWVDASTTVNFETWRVASSPARMISDSNVYSSVSNPQSELLTREDLYDDSRYLSIHEQSAITRND
ncbi:hypothetical protein A7U60_g5765 [Sanghuangporus baumii]|uniref:Uncharacterized protein n=1 Tax=Sanghuangporus baumii TaxID=108892 RepID=A0A9Q5N2V9_SANBA|nr:hypothetical protein A7U60_g5765 [Sanghuangporus baumii]